LSEHRELRSLDSFAVVEVRLATYGKNVKTLFLRLFSKWIEDILTVLSEKGVEFWVINVFCDRHQTVTCIF